MVIPLPLIYRARLPMLRKIQLALLFCVSIFVVSITVVRMPVIFDDNVAQKSRTLWASIGGSPLPSSSPPPSPTSRSGGSGANNARRARESRGHGSLPRRQRAGVQQLPAHRQTETAPVRGAPGAAPPDGRRKEGPDARDGPGQFRQSDTARGSGQPGYFLPSRPGGA